MLRILVICSYLLQYHVLFKSNCHFLCLDAKKVTKEKSRANDIQHIRSFALIKLLC